MTSKKNQKANLERNKSTFFLLGITISLSFALISFEWGTREMNHSAMFNLGDETFEIEEIPNTIQEEPEPITPPEVNIPEMIEIVDNTIELQNPSEFFSDLTSTNAEIPMYVIKAPLNDAEKVGEDFFEIVEDMPKFRGGEVSKFSQWVNEHIRYPKLAEEIGIQGKVFISFMVEPDGSVSTVTILRSVDKLLDEEAIRVVLSSPKWTPGKQRGVPVRVRFSISINYQL
jgi:periplasmic protein TonB